uniref:Uncharacterized protein n=1 Tax=Lactuca sativa TaxID=4236 RepID=A0A9R1UY38_LACSA|nr:hypothetical protein LSAT_V11C700373780 [Lactuca sativa]
MTFGLGELNEEFVNEQDDGDTDLEDSDCDKDEDDYVESMKEKLNLKLNDAITKFPEKESFRIFKEKITNIIVEEKTKSTNFLNFQVMKLELKNDLRMKTILDNIDRDKGNSEGIYKQGGEVEKGKGDNIGNGKSELGNKGEAEAKKTEGNDGGGDKQREVEKENAHDRGKEKSKKENKKEEKLTR